jgi:regulator of replication initiation timing
MPDPVLSPGSGSTNVVTQSPAGGDPIIAKGFDDPAFLQAAEKAFADRAEQAMNPTREEADAEQTPTAPAPVARSQTQTTEPKIDRPPTPRKASEWAAFHDAKVQVEKERDELKSKLEVFNGFDPKEYDSLKTERQKLAERLEAVALEKSDKFQKHFNGEADSIKALIKSAMGDKAEKAIKLLDLPDSDWRTEQLEALSEDLTPLRRARLERAVADMDKLQIERNKVIENSSENWKKLQEAQAMETTREKEKLNSVFDREIKSMGEPEKGVAPFIQKDGDAAWNKGVKERIEKARQIFSGDISPEEKARYAAFSSALPEFEKTFASTLEENAKLKAELGKLRVSEPGLESSETTSDTDGDKYKGLTHGDALAKMIAEAGGFSGR